MKNNKIEVQPGHVRASLELKSFNEEDRTVDVIWTTGSRVKRYSFEGEYLEELSLKKSHVNLERLNNGAPVLNNHGTGNFGGVRDLNDVIGTVVSGSAKIERDKDGKQRGIATLKLSNRDNVSGIVQDIREGIIRNISVGYRINKFEEQKAKVEGIPVLRATDWTPMELSFVGIPADAGAQARSEQPTNDAIVIKQEGDTMELKENKRAEEAPVTEEVKEQAEETATDVETPEQTQTDEPKADAPESDKAEGERSDAVETATENVEDARAIEMSRQSEIRKNCDLLGLERSFADGLCDQKIDLDKARSLIFKEKEKQTNGKTKNQRVEVSDMDQVKARKEAFGRTIMHRADSEKYKLEQGDGDLVRHSLIETARAFLEMQGVSGVRTMDNFEIARRALHSTSDFTAILADSSNKFLRAGYENYGNTYEPFVRKRAAKDFKELTSIIIGNGGTLQAVNEHGEYKATTLDESAEKYKVQKYGLIVGKTYELMVNDDMDALSEIPRRLGQRAREKENEIFWGLITANAGAGQTLAETGQPLFDAAHGNVAATGGVIDIDSMGAGRTAMSLQRDLDGELIRTRPRHLVVPAALELTADQFLTQTTPQANGQVNPFAGGSLQKLMEPRLDEINSKTWYMFGNASESPIAEMASLGGRGPEIFTQEGFDVDGMQLKVRHHFGMRVVDFRNVYKNGGPA